VKIYNYARSASQIQQDWLSNKPTSTTVSLTVNSQFGSPDPAVGTHDYPSGTELTISAVHSITEGDITYVCTGFTGTGSVPSTGYDSWTTFTLSEDSSITWNWRSISVTEDRYDLPSIGIDFSGKLVDRARLVSVAPQTLTVSPGKSFSFNYNYQIWQGSNPSEIDQLLFICSWTPTWPPESEYYYGVYDSIPPSFPGIEQSGSISFTAPSIPGTYYIWFAFGSHYSMEQAVNGFSTPFDGFPGHVKLTVEEDVPNEQKSLTVSSSQGISSPIVGVHNYDFGDQVTASVSSPLFVDDTLWTCNGWTGTGSVPTSGSGTIVAFNITEDSSITWNWISEIQNAFSISVTPQTKSITAGEESVQYAIDVSLLLGSVSETALKLFDPPSWLNWNFSPHTGVPPFSSTLSIQVLSSAPEGEHILYVQGENSEISNQIKEITLNVEHPAQQNLPGFSLPIDGLVAILAVVAIGGSTSVLIWRIRNKKEKSLKFIPHINDPFADKDQPI